MRSGRGEIQEVNPGKEYRGTNDRQDGVRELAEKTEQHASEEKLLDCRHNEGRHQNPRQGVQNGSIPSVAQDKGTGEQQHRLQQNRTEHSGSQSDGEITQRAWIGHNAELRKRSNAQRAQQGPQHENRRHLQAAREIPVKRHALNVSDQTM